MNSSETAGSTGSKLPPPNDNPASNRKWWLLAILLTLILVGLFRREQIGKVLANYALSRATEASVGLPEIFVGIAEVVSPSIPEIDLVRARLARRDGDFGNAEQHVARAKFFGGDPQSLELEHWLAIAQRGQTEMAEQKLPELLEQDGADAAEICRAFVLGYMRERKFSAALLLIDGWRAETPDDPSPLVFRGQILTELRQTMEAEEAYRGALELNPQNARAALGLGQLLVDSKRTDEATDYFATAAETDFNGAVAAYVGWTSCLRSLGRTDEAKSILEEGLAKYPDEADLILEKANLLIDSGDYQLAIDLLQPEISRKSKRQDLNYVYATALRGIDRLDEAAKHFEYASEAARETIKANELIAEVPSRPDDVELRFQIGSKHLMFGNSRDGLIWLESVLRLSPDHQPTHRVLAEYYASRIADDPRFIGLSQRHRAQAGPIEANP